MITLFCKQKYYICDMEITERIREIIREKQLTASSFADMLGVQRSGISHIFSGRNKPSLDIILKIKDTFPEISLDWLLKGTGSTKNVQDQGLTHGHSTLDDAKTHREITNVNIENLLSESTNVTNVNIETGHGKKIVSVLILRADGTFTEYHPDDR
jgi:transcriptional regulator with XRE-family HTH domain